jgi:hypothetical protein
MREKKWVDCPSCGAKNSMEYRTGLVERREPKGYPPFEVGDLEGYLCSLCKEGFWSRASERKITAASAEHRARHDSGHVVAADLASVNEAAALLQVSVQAVHQMMDAGRMRYVYAGDFRLPIRKYLKEAGRAGLQSHAPR